MNTPKQNMQFTQNLYQYGNITEKIKDIPTHELRKITYEELKEINNKRKKKAEEAIKTLIEEHPTGFKNTAEIKELEEKYWHKLYDMMAIYFDHPNFQKKHPEKLTKDIDYFSMIPEQFTTILEQELHNALTDKGGKITWRLLGNYRGIASSVFDHDWAKNFNELIKYYDVENYDVWFYKKEQQNFFEWMTISAIITLKFIEDIISKSKINIETEQKDHYLQQINELLIKGYKKLEDYRNTNHHSSQLVEALK